MGRHAAICLKWAALVGALLIGTPVWSQSNAVCDTRGLQRITGTAPCPAQGPAADSARRTGLRAALVIGQGHYGVAGSSDSSPADARRIAAALTASGWHVQATADLDATAMKDTVDRFAAALHPGDAALVYFSGLSAKGPAMSAGAGTENYLLGIDADAAAPGDLIRAGLPLSAILLRLNAAHPGGEVVIVDAARPSLIEGRWSAAAGLAEPTSSAQANAYIVFPAAPGRLAREGIFASALETAIGTYGMSAGRLFPELSATIDRATAGGQTPWYSGSSLSAQIVIGPAGTVSASDGADRAQAIACGTADCLLKAAGRIADSHLAIDLQLRAEVAGAESLPETTMAAPAQNYVEAFIEANQSSPDGKRRIGLLYLFGGSGFPVSPEKAYAWLMRASSAGDAEAAFELAPFFALGKPPVGHVDKDEAVQLYRMAAEKGHAGAAYYLGMAYRHGEGGLAVDPALADLWIGRAAAAGDKDALTAIKQKQ